LMSLRRKLLEQATKVEEVVNENATADEILSNVQALFNFKMKSDRQTQIFDIAQATLQNIENRYKNKETEKLYTGFRELDNITCGLHKQELTIVAARPGIGKTAFALQLMRNLVQSGNRCIFFSREMSNTSLCERLLSAMTGIDSQTIRYAKKLEDADFVSLNRAMSKLMNFPILINDTATTVEQIRSFCHRVRAVDVVIVDYIGLCKTTVKTQNREREVSEISWALKSLSSEFDIPVVALSQLNRECAKDGREPSLTDLRDSGSLEQDASNVLFLHVPKETDESANNFDIKVIVAKQRNGPAGKFIWLGYNKKTFNFGNKERGA
jgi:replicative DNA helicase